MNDFELTHYICFHPIIGRYYLPIEAQYYSVSGGCYFCPGLGRVDGLVKVTHWLAEYSYCGA